MCYIFKEKVCICGLAQFLNPQNHKKGAKFDDTPPKFPSCFTATPLILQPCQPTGRSKGFSTNILKNTNGFFPECCHLYFFTFYTFRPKERCMTKMDGVSYFHQEQH